MQLAASSSWTSIDHKDHKTIRLSITSVSLEKQFFLHSVSHCGSGAWPLRSIYQKTKQSPSSGKRRNKVKYEHGCFTVIGNIKFIIRGEASFDLSHYKLKVCAIVPAITFKPVIRQSKYEKHQWVTITISVTYDLVTLSLIAFHFIRMYDKKDQTYIISLCLSALCGSKLSVSIIPCRAWLVPHLIVFRNRFGGVYDRKL